MNIVLITGKRSMRNLDTVLKKSEQAVTVGKYTSVRPNTATEIYEKYRPHGILVGDDTVTKCVSLIDFLSIIKMRYGYMRIIFMCSNDSSFNKYASALYSIGVYDIVVGYDPAAIDYAILNPKTETPDIPVTEDSSDENKELSYPDRKVHEYPGNFVGINYKDVSDNSYSMQTVRLTENYERIQRGNVIISVFGYNSRCGSTYTAFDIAFYLHKYERAKVCIVTAVTAGLCKYFNVDETTVNENGFNIDDVIIYSCFDKISDTFDYIVCDDGNEICGKKISDVIAKELTLKRSTSIIKGFTSQSGKTFDAKLTIKADNTIGFEFPERLKCPVCGKEMIKSSKGWVCTGYKNGCNFFIAGTICGKCITDTIATMLCANKRTRIINGFTSKSGKAFSAALIVKDGKIDFDFPAQSQKRSK